MKENEKQVNPTVFEVVIPWAKINAAYSQKLTKLAETAEIKGFRKGKAPLKLVEEKVGKSQLYSDVIEIVLPAVYQTEVNKRGLLPMISPRVKPINIKENTDWKFEITVVIKPEVDLGNYKEKVQESIKKYPPPQGYGGAGKKVEKEENDKHNTANNEQNTEQNKTGEQDRKMRVVFDVLLKTVKIELPQILVDEEVNLRLSQLIDQVKALGMTVEQYLQAKKLTHQGIRAEYEKTARDMLKLNLTLDAIAAQKKFEGKDRISKAMEYLFSL